MDCMTQSELDPVMSLRRALEVRSPKVNNELRFAGGTEYGTNFKYPPERAYDYTPLPETVRTPSLFNLPSTAPTSHLKKDGPMELWHPLNETDPKKRHLKTASGLFPRLGSSAEQALGKLEGVVDELEEQLAKHDKKGEGFMHQDELKVGLRQSGVFLTEADMGELLRISSRNGNGEVNWVELLNQVRGIAPDNTWKTSTGLIFGRPTLPPSYQWDASKPYQVSLRLRPNSQPYEFSGGEMAQFAKMLTRVRSYEDDAEKVHSIIRYELMQTLVIEPGPPGHPDLSFRRWLADNGILSITSRNYNGPYPPEVYDVLDQVIYGIGLPIVLSSTMTLTAEGGSMRHLHH